MTDPTMDAISRAVAEGQTRDPAGARRTLLGLWAELGAAGDPLHRCTLAHHLADLHPDPAEALAWNVRALDAADALTDERTAAHHPGLAVAGFYPSLHLNLADDYRRLGSFEAAQRHIDAALAHAPALADDPYGQLIGDAITRTAASIAERRTD
ncbi:hypothetical protein GCM10009830_48030 [Glycomyces endophyticus]|uniref:Tetratricopeptide repeat protein n=1 Tax=Glycomyces endophyticus TaxID=480996 RepID=A0ABP4TX97_9ACTN